MEEENEKKEEKRGFPSESIHDIGLLNKLIHDQLGCKINQNLKSMDLTFQQLRILDFLQNSGGFASQKSIAEDLRVSGPTMVGLLQRLETKGFVETKIDPSDKRMRIVRITEKAGIVGESMMKHHDLMEQIICRGMTEQERNTLIHLLNHVYKNLQQDLQEDN